MYTREILPPRSSPIENGVPLQGTWNRAFEEVDLLDIRRPYSWPLPRWIRDNRIKECEWFSVQDDRFMLDAFLTNLKMYRIAQIFLYDKENGQKYVFRKVRPGTGWHLPRSLSNSSVESRSGRIFFRIHNWLDADTIKLDINIRGAARRLPSLTVHLAYNMSGRDVSPMAVSLPFAERRNLYVFKALTAVRGDIVFGGQHISLNPERCSGFFSDYKGFFPYLLRYQSCAGMGFDEKGRRFGFQIAENQTRENRRNNENALWVNGRLTPLPPVRITMPEGPESDWVIQDVEGMVDLVFTPKERVSFGAGLLITTIESDIPLGQYNGMVADADGEQIQVRGLWGTGMKLYLRV